MKGMRRKWSEKIRRVTVRKECFLVWRRTRREEDLEENRRMEMERGEEESKLRMDSKYS